LANESFKIPTYYNNFNQFFQIAKLSQLLHAEVQIEQFLLLNTYTEAKLLFVKHL